MSVVLACDLQNVGYKLNMSHSLICVIVYLQDLLLTLSPLT